MSTESIILWSVASAVVLAIVIPYVLRFRRRVASDVVRKQEAARLGIDRPAAQFPYVDMFGCVGCGACVAACPEGDVLGVVGGTAVVINGLRCVGHGLCGEACPVGAIEVGLGDLRSRADVPVLDENHQTTIRGLFVAGELGGLSLVRNAVLQGRGAVEHIFRERGRELPATKDQVDIVVVGSGPAGLSAALTARVNGLSCVVLEREEDLGGSLLHYPRRKMVLTRPVELPPWGTLEREEYRKEELLGLFEGLVEGFDLRVRFGEAVEAITRTAEGFRLRSTSGETASRFVVLAQGRRGLPRKLGVAGEDRAKVLYRLIDAASYRGSRILVVGGGDSAVEAALGLAREPSNEVTLSYRREKLVRIKKKNQDLVDRAIEDALLRPAFGSRVVEIGDDHVRLELADGSMMNLDNDFVFVFVGGVPPFELLRSTGAGFGGRAAEL